MLAFFRKLCYYMQAVERQQVNIRVWRSLVSRLNGVQEAAGSNPVTRTNNRESTSVDSLLFFACRKPAASCISIAAGKAMLRMAFPLVRIQSLGPLRPKE